MIKHHRVFNKANTFSVVVYYHHTVRLIDKFGTFGKALFMRIDDNNQRVFSDTIKSFFGR